MNDNERKIYEKYESQGYDVIHVGVPDLILLKDGEIEFVEVKTASNLLRESQMRAIALLEKHGFSVRVERVPTVQKSALLAEWAKTNQTRPGHTMPIQTTPGQAMPRHTNPNHLAVPTQARPLHAIPVQPKPYLSNPNQSTPSITEVK